MAFAATTCIVAIADAEGLAMTATAMMVSSSGIAPLVVVAAFRLPRTDPGAMPQYVPPGDSVGPTYRNSHHLSHQETKVIAAKTLGVRQTG